MDMKVLNGDPQLVGSRMGQEDTHAGLEDTHAGPEDSRMQPLEDGYMVGDMRMEDSQEVGEDMMMAGSQQVGLDHKENENHVLCLFPLYHHQHLSQCKQMLHPACLRMRPEDSRVQPLEDSHMVGDTRMEPLEDIHTVGDTRMEDSQKVGEDMMIVDIQRVGVDRKENEIHVLHLSPLNHHQHLS